MPNSKKLNIKLRTFEGSRQILDTLRAKWIAYTPEEHVRQLFLLHLIQELGYPAENIAVEYPFCSVSGKNYRADIVVFDTNLKPMLLVECKSMDIILTSKTFEQATRYNAIICAPYLLITNGKKHYLVHTTNFIDYKQLTELPSYTTREISLNNNSQKETK